MADPLRSFPPLIASDAKLLILGSMPGVESLRRQQYYAHPRNAFWPIMAKLLGSGLPDTYEGKTKLLLENRIGLWDAAGSCYRDGSLDQNIRKVVPNDFGKLFAGHPGITHIFCNGTKAYDLLRRLVLVPDSVICERLPSTSPAHAIPFERKLEAWRAVTAALRPSVSG